MSVLHVWIAFLLLIHTMTFWRKLATLIYPSWLNVHLHSLHPYIEGPHSVCTFWSNVNLIVTMICCFPWVHSYCTVCPTVRKYSWRDLSKWELEFQRIHQPFMAHIPHWRLFLSTKPISIWTCICCQYGYLLILYSIGPCMGETCDSDKIELNSLIWV